MPAGYDGGPEPPPLRHNIRQKMIVLIALPTLVIYIGVLGVALARLRAEGRAEIEAETTRLARNLAARFDRAFRETAAIADTTAAFMEIVPDLSEAQIFAVLSANTRLNPVVYGAAMAFEPGTYLAGDELYCPYVHRGPDGGGELHEMHISRDVYDWYSDPAWQWWHKPKNAGKSVWTDPYFDEGAGNVLMVTYSAPFYRDGRLRGVTTVDIMLPTLRASVGREILESLDFAILTASGQYVFSPVPSAIMNQTIFERADELGRHDMAEAARPIVSGESGVVALDGWEDRPGRQWVFYAPIKSTGWAFAATISEHEVLAGVRARMTQLAVALAATLALIIGCIWFVSGMLTRPIETLRRKVNEIAGGNLEARVEGIDTTDEIGELAASFNRMTADLRSNVARLADEQATREKMERDLDLAREIQRGLLPRTRPSVPGFDLAGWNQAAEKTGGDYFDWLELPGGRTIITLADVTGHGIGPAMIVAVCRAYMRASTSGGTVPLSTALARVNDLLHADIPEERFVTAAVAVIDPAANRMTLVSAGQAPMLFYEAGTGTVHNWDAQDLPLGVVGGLSFDTPVEIEFKPGDVLVLTTDGFFEWHNPEGKQFGTARLIDFVKTHHGLAADAMISSLHETVVAYARGTPQADDLTAVVIKKL